MLLKCDTYEEVQAFIAWACKQNPPIVTTNLKQYTPKGNYHVPMRFNFVDNRVRGHQGQDKGRWPARSYYNQYLRAIPVTHFIDADNYPEYHI